MTEHLFKNDAYLKTFRATIIETLPFDDKHLIVLDRTAFYPEGGGQPGDRGTIDSKEVLDTFYHEGKIGHLVAELPDNTTDLACTIDWEHRFDLMQQHAGQHLLSGAFEKLHDANTIGFHLSDDYVTIDLDKKLSSQAIDQVEQLANQHVFDNLEIHLLYPTPEELHQLPLRKQPKVDKDIRVVNIGYVDFSPCGGTHPKRSGEIGTIKIKKVENHKIGVRVEFICGWRAFKDYREKNKDLYAIANKMSIKTNEVEKSVSILIDDLSTTNKTINELKSQLLTFEADTLAETGHALGDYTIVSKVFEQRDFKEIKNIALKLTEMSGHIALLGIKNEGITQLIYSCSKDIKDISMKDLFKDAISTIDGKGGGNQFSCQGGGSAVDKIDQAIESTLTDLKARFE